MRIVSIKKRYPLFLPRDQGVMELLARNQLSDNRLFISMTICSLVSFFEIYGLNSNGVMPD